MGVVKRADLIRLNGIHFSGAGGGVKDGFSPKRKSRRNHFLRLAAGCSRSGNAVGQSYEQPRLSPQFRHLKHAPLRTAMWPHLGQAGASP